MKELLHPWKPITLTLGMTWLFWGALMLSIPDQRSVTHLPH
ncbi:MAG: hypothetical protein Q8O37_03025 [Sulfuricellaceae bacterium]|jgi:hypothetical protein|nr:hypothetical protein [Sulfuricellaceae bacterium]